MTGGDSGVGSAAERRVEARATGVGQRRLHGDDAHVGHRSIVEATERVHPDAGDLDGHVGLKLQTVRSPSCSVTTRIG